MGESIKKWVKALIFVVGLYTICVFLFDYNNGVVTMDIKGALNKTNNAIVNVFK